MIHYKNEYGHYRNAIDYTDSTCIISYFGKVSKKTFTLYPYYIN